MPDIQGRRVEGKGVSSGWERTTQWPRVQEHNINTEPTENGETHSAIAAACQQASQSDSSSQLKWIFFPPLFLIDHLFQWPFGVLLTGPILC